MAKIIESTQLQCEKSRVTSLPSNDFIKLVLNSDLLVREMRGRHENRTNCHSSLPLYINVQVGKKRTTLDRFGCSSKKTASKIRHLNLCQAIQMPIF
jgi:hypothetical protein